jgi:hypothetical protein
VGHKESLSWRDTLLSYNSLIGNRCFQIMPKVGSLVLS